MMCKLHRKRQIIPGHSILIVPAAEKGRGGGHICRCITLANDLRAGGRDAFLLISPQTRDLSGLYNSMDFNPKWCVTNEELEIRNIKLGETFEFIILDRFQTPLDELLQWKKIAPVIGIDEGGSFRSNFDFLIDILIPQKMKMPCANIASPGLLKFPESNKDQKIIADGQKEIEPRPVPANSGNSLIKILITFGQEDSAGLGLKTAKYFSSIKNSGGLDITLIKGALAKNREQQTMNPQLPQNIKVMENTAQLAQHLCEYDLVITHYGITAYEALYAKTPVLLAHPTLYHKKLSKAAGFCSFSKKSIKNIDVIGRRCEALAESLKLREKKNLCGLISAFSPQVNRFCPVCGFEKEASCVSRFNDRTYRRCSGCGIIFMDRLTQAPIEYEREYFFESYRKQYGKTYLEDFDSIKETGQRRIKTISKLRDANAKEKLLDIGCAYGPFLAAAREEGYSPAGIDPAKDAVNYVREKLGIPAVQGFFPDARLSACNSGLFDVITLWYVIEHFTNCVPVLAEIKKLLKPDGILAFSTPSCSGISGRFSLRAFLSASPSDHWTVWQPKMCEKALALAGFKVKKIIIAGHHPQRFPVFGRFAYTAKSPVKGRKTPIYWILLAISKIFGLGDTFEVYAVNSG